MTRDEEMYMKGWRACEFHFQKHYRAHLASELTGKIQGYHLSYSEEKALEYFNEKEETNETSPEAA